MALHLGPRCQHDLSGWRLISAAGCSCNRQFPPNDQPLFLQSTVGCVVPTSDPNILLAALGSNVVEVDVQNKKTGRIVAFVSTDDNAEGTRFNDGKATPQGVFIVGRMNKAWREGQPGKLFAMDLRVSGNSFGLLTILGPTEVSLTHSLSISPAVQYTRPVLLGQLKWPGFWCNKFCCCCYFV